MGTFLRTVIMALLPSIACVVLVHTAVAGEYGFLAYRRLDEERTRVQRQVEEQRAANAQLAREIARLASDPESIRRAIAADLQLVPTGSTVYRFGAAHSAPASIPAEAEAEAAPAAP